MYCREDGTPYYIGKGKGNRINDPNHTMNLPLVERRKYLKTNLTEEESFNHEVYMIHVLGRKDTGTGILRNLTDGGDGCTGNIVSVETREKLSKLKKGKKFSEEHKNNISKSLTGLKRPEEFKNKLSKTLKKQYSLKERKPTFEGKKHSKESKEKISNSNKGRKVSEETRRRISEGVKRTLMNKNL